MTDITDNWHQYFDSKYLKIILKSSLQIIQEFKGIIDTYVLDFYVDDHWSKLPNAWRNHLEPLNPNDLANILCGITKSQVVRPLSIICLMKLMKQLCIPREVKIEKQKPSAYLVEHPKLRNIFTKCVKPKKRHEIDKMAKICYKSAVEHSVDFVVDFGAGLGHLARVLGYGFGVQVCCLEMQHTLNEQAKLIDSQLEAVASKFLTVDQRSHFRTPVHITLKLTKSFSSKDIVDKIMEALKIPKNSTFTFGIVGLHPCGDLGATLIQIFLSCKEAKFINFVGCCYMKITTGRNLTDPGYPLCNFLNNEAEISSLSYESREIACHATEVYCDRLSQGMYEDLKVHSFRATIEKIFMKYWPELKHSGLRSVKHTRGMTFEDYVKRATNGLNINVPVEDIHSETTKNDLNQWKRIVIFYTMRLLFAPLIETVVLYDRVLYLMEKGATVDIRAIFDPRLSPRNHITCASKQ